MTAPILEVKNLGIRFTTRDGEVRAVEDLSFSVQPGEVLGIVGESGSGKTQAALGLMGLLADNGRMTGSVRLAGTELAGLDAAALGRIRGLSWPWSFKTP